MKHVYAILAIGIVSVVIAFGMPLIVPVQAAAPLVPDNCEEITVVGTIHTYQCEDLSGQPYLTNTMGFISR